LGREFILEWGEDVCNGYVSVVRMIEAIREIGEYAVGGTLNKDALLDAICMEVP